jgi:hypothetical protein
MAGLTKIFAECYINTDMWVVSKMIHEYFMECIYEPAQELRRANQIRFDIPVWTTRQIHDHFMHHIHDPRVFCLKSVKMLNIIQNMLADNLTEKEVATGEIKPNLKVIRILLDVHKRNMEVRKLEHKGMFAFDSTLPLDTNKATQIIARNTVTMTRNE